MKQFIPLSLGVLLGLLPSAIRAQNVGIGTTAPTQRLDVNGNLRLRGLSGASGRLPQVQADGTLGVLNNPASSGTAAANPVLLNPDPPLGTTGGTPLTVGSISNGYTVARVQSTLLVAGTTAYVAGEADFLASYDVSNPAQPLLLGRRRVPKNTGLDLRMAISGNRLYMGIWGFNADGYLRKLDISQPAKIAVLDSIQISPTTIGAVAAAGNMVYATVGNTAASNPSNPSVLVVLDNSTGTLVQKGSVALPSYSFNLVVSGSLVYATCVNGSSGNGTLQVVDVSNPAAPVLRGAGAATDGPPHGLAISGSVAYVLTTKNRFQVFDVSSPTPQLVTAFDTGTQPYNVAVNGSTAYVINAGSNTLQTFDISQPTNPAFRGQVTTGAYPSGLAVDDQVAYVTSSPPAASTILQAFRTNNVRPLGLLADGTLTTTSVPTLSVNGQQLGISGGNTVTLPSTDNLGNHVATQNLDLASYRLVGNGGSQGLSIGSGGNVGLGTTAPGQLLELAGQAAPTLLLHSNGNSLTTGATLQFRESSTDFGWNLRHNSGGPEGGNANTNDLLVLERLQGSGSILPVMVWDQNTGNVGLGTTTPGVALDVVGAARVSTSLSTPALLTPTTGAHNMAPIAYGTYTSTGQLINSSDNVSVTGSNGTYTLTINGSSSGSYIITASSYNDDAAAYGYAVDYRPYSVNGSSNPPVNRIVTYKPGVSQPASHGFSFVVYQP